MDCSLPGTSVHGHPRQECWSGLPFPSPEDLPDPGVKFRSPALQAEATVYTINKMLAFPTNSYVEILTPRTTVSRGGVFGRLLGHKDGAPMNGICALIKGTQRVVLPLPPYKITGRRWLSMNQESGLHQTVDLPVPLSWSSWPPETWEINAHCLSCPACGIFVTAA